MAIAIDITDKIRSNMAIFFISNFYLSLVIKDIPCNEKLYDWSLNCLDKFYFEI